MPKGTALKDFVEVDDIDLSSMARAAVFSSEHERIDVSGFTPSAFNEYVAGTTEQTLTITFYGAYGTGETHQTLWPIHRDRSVVVIRWRPDQTAAVSADNPELTANVQLLTYGSPNRTRGEAETYDAVFTAADENGFDFIITPTP